MGTPSKSYPQRLIIQLGTQRRYRESIKPTTDSDEATDNKRAFVLASEVLKNSVHTAIHHNHVEDVYGPQGA